MITLEPNYRKKIGLTGNSSNQLSVSLKTELADLSQVGQGGARLYSVLQQSVDNNIQEIGYLPNSNGNNSNGRGNGNGNGTGQNQSQGNENGAWNCSGKQRDLILKIIEEHKLEKTKVEKLAEDRFGKGVKALNKLEASGLIEELLEQTGQKGNGRGRFQSRYQRAGGAR